MHVEDFVKSVANDLKAFADAWKEKHAQDPSNWPLEASEGDWYEQFLFFCGQKEK